MKFLIFAFAVFAIDLAIAAPTVVHSPNDQVSVTLEVNHGALYYSVSKNGTPLVDSSRMEILKGATMVLVDQSIRENDTEWEPDWGQFSSIRDRHRELALSLVADDLPVQLLVRVFDTGIGFRFLLPENSRGMELAFFNEYRPLKCVAHYAGEQGLEFPEKTRKKYGFVPVVSACSDGRYLAFLESDLYSASRFELMNVQFNETDQSITALSSTTSSGEGQVTAWRTILIGENAGDLVVNTVALNLAAPGMLKDTSWINPGKGLWDWRVHGYDNGDFVYGIDTRSYLRYIDFCAEQGIEYLTVDSGWYASVSDGEMVFSPEVDVEKVMSYAHRKGVKILLYYDIRGGDFGDDEVFSHYAGLGASGMKYGFRRNNAGFTRMAMESAAENNLLLNFHDGPVPMAGVERTLPNLITREYCHAQYDRRTAFSPETFLKMAIVASLSGPLDMANGSFGIKGINAGERNRGPSEKDSFVSTVTREVARTLVIYSGLVTLPDAPEEYLKKPDLFEFLKIMPSTWDDTRILNSKFGTYITTARRSGDTWFVATVNNETARTLDIHLDFLEQGRTYKARLFQDASDAHGLKNPEAYTVTTSTVKHGETISADMAVGGGHAMILEPVQY